MHIALIGTRGIPATYGGFETAVEEIGCRLVAGGHRVTVYGREPVPGNNYRGMQSVTLPAIRRKSLETMSHTTLAVFHAIRHRPDVAFVFNAANAPQALALKASGIPYAIHVDGLEWQRSKWGWAGRRWYLSSELIAARTAPLIADAQGIQDYYLTRYGVPSHKIAYGAPLIRPDCDRLHEVDLIRGQYLLAVARLEPENNVHVIVRAHADAENPLPLVVVGSAPYGGTYVRQLTSSADRGARFLGSIYDQDLLNQIYGNARLYLHGHSVGGTNPSLLRAVGAGAPVAAFDTPFNREVLSIEGTYWHDEASLTNLLDRSMTANSTSQLSELDRKTTQIQNSVLGRYNWDDVASAYERLALKLVK